MNNTSGLAELIERVERAMGPDREIDRLIARLVGWHRVEPRFSRSRKGGWIAPEDFMGVESSGAPRLDSLHGTTIWPDVPAYTASIDAALVLLERVLPGWTVANVGQDDTKRWWAELREGFQTSYSRVATSGPLASPALALVLSTLKALQEEQKT